MRGAACALGALWLCTVINLAGVREAARVQMFTTLLKLVPLLLFGVLGLTVVHASAYRPFNPGGLPLFGVATATAALTLWAMLGFEAATVPTGVVRDPERTVPRATVIGMLLAGVATMLACTVVIGLLPTDVLRRSSAPMIEAATHVWGRPAGIGLAVVAVISCFGALNGWVLLQAQTPMAAAQDRLFPAAFGRLDARGTPAFGLLLSSSLASVLIVANFSRSLVALFTFSILLSTATTLLPYLVSVLAWWKIEPVAAPWRRLVALAALLYAGWALVGTGLESMAWGAVLVALGLPVYLWQRRERTR